jgi:hypothetical protein
VPFHLWTDHFMFARGGFGPHQDLNFFIDSGLVYVIDDRQACLYTTAQHYRRWGVPHPPPHFTAPAPIHLGPLSQTDQFVATTPTRRVDPGLRQPRIHLYPAHLTTPAADRPTPGLWP